MPRLLSKSAHSRLLSFECLRELSYERIPPSITARQTRISSRLPSDTSGHLRNPRSFLPLLKIQWREKDEKTNGGLTWQSNVLVIKTETGRLKSSCFKHIERCWHHLIRLIADLYFAFWINNLFSKLILFCKSKRSDWGWESSPKQLEENSSHGVPIQKGINRLTIFSFFISLFMRWEIFDEVRRVWRIKRELDVLESRRG